MLLTPLTLVSFVAPQRRELHVRLRSVGVKQLAGRPRRPRWGSERGIADVADDGGAMGHRGRAASST
jgi:hypothetical protein